MTLIETIASGATLALMGGLLGLWYRDNARFQPIGMAVFALSSAALVLAIVVDTSYAAGTSAQWRADVAWAQAAGALSATLPARIDGENVIPSWLWICAGLLWFVSGTLTRWLGGRGAPHEKAEPGTAIGDDHDRQP